MKRIIKRRKPNFAPVSDEAMKSHLRPWYLIACSAVPPVWAATNWHEYTRVAGDASAVSYLALLVSPVLFFLGSRRLFDGLEPDARWEWEPDASSEE